MLKLRDRLSSESVSALLDAYKSGVSSRDLAQQYGIAHSSVGALIEEGGVPRQQPRMTSDEQDEAVRMYESGLSMSAVGERLGRSQGTIWHLLRRRGVEARTLYPGRNVSVPMNGR